METTTATTSEGKEIVGTPTVLIQIPYYWGKGATITEAWKQVKRASGGNLRKIRSGSYVIYFGHDTDEVKFRCTEMGYISHHSAFPSYVIEHHKGKGGK